MAQDNPLCGAPRIHGELLKLGMEVSQATVAKYFSRSTPPPSQSWRTFLANHVGQIVAADFLVVPTATCRLLLVLVLLAHDRRRIEHVAAFVDVVIVGRKAVTIVPAAPVAMRQAHWSRPTEFSAGTV